MRAWSRLMWLLLGGLVVGLLVVLACAGYRVTSEHHFVISNVELTGTLQYNQPAQLEQEIKQVLTGNFFTANVHALRDALLQLPWVQEAVVRRHWPDTLEVEIQESQPLACWGEDAILTESFTLAPMNDLVCDESWPHFYSFSVKPEEVYRQFERFTAQLSPLSLRVVQMTVSERGQSTVVLDNGLVLKLGRPPYEDKLERFVLAAGGALRHRFSQVEAVDLRYTNGMAVGWKHTE